MFKTRKLLILALAPEDIVGGILTHLALKFMPEMDDKLTLLPKDDPRMSKPPGVLCACRNDDKTFTLSWETPEVAAKDFMTYMKSMMPPSEEEGDK